MERRSSVGGGHIKKLKVGAGLAIPPYPYTQESVGEGGGQGTRADGRGATHSYTRKRRASGASTLVQHEVRTTHERMRVSWGWTKSTPHAERVLSSG